MKILSRYCLKEFIPPFLISLICFTSIILFDELFRLVKLFVKKGVGPLYLIESLFYIAPATVVLSIPMAALVAILLALGRLSTDSEIMAMRANGVGLHQLMVPLLCATFLLSIVDLAVIEYMLPHATQASVQLKRDIQKHNPAIILEEGTIMKELQSKGKLWMFESTDPETKRLQNVKIWDKIMRNRGQPRFTLAKSATLNYEGNEAKLTLYDGQTYEPLTDGSDGYRITQFREQRIALDFTKDLERRDYTSQHPQTMRIGELNTYIDKLTASIKPEKPSIYTLNRLRYARVEYHKKFALPFACLAFGLIGIPLGIMVKKNGKMIGFGIGLSVILLYYLLLQIGQSTGTNGQLHPAFAMWLPNLVVSTIGIVLILTMLYESKVRAFMNKESTISLVMNSDAVT